MLVLKIFHRENLINRKPANCVNIMDKIPELNHTKHLTKNLFLTIL